MGPNPAPTRICPRGGRIILERARNEGQRMGKERTLTGTLGCTTRVRGGEGKGADRDAWVHLCIARVRQRKRGSSHALGKAIANATSSLMVSYFFSFLGSIVFSRGSKKVLFWRTVQEQ